MTEPAGAEQALNRRLGDGRDDLHPWLWLWFPPLLLIVQYGFYFYDTAAYRRFIVGEIGLVELATPLLALIGAVCGSLALRYARYLPGLVIRCWLVITILGCIYLAGEELSWGQQLFHWHTPESLQAINDQSETNLHNISSWFDQKPRLALEIWVLLGGIVMPLLRSRRERLDPRTHWELDWRNWFWPTYVALPTALLAIVIRLPERIKTLFDLDRVPFEIRYSETQEYYFALFLLIYLASIGYRLRRLVANRRTA
jgi:hypothetical protein